jgi:hypothetical protein
MRFPRVLIVPLALLAVACGGPAPDRALVAALGPGAAAWAESASAARRAFDAGRWADAARALETQIAAAPAPLPDGPAGSAIAAGIRVAFYDLACARARLGRPEAALDALEQALRDGGGEIGHDTLLRDADLLPLRGQPRWDALVRRLSWHDGVRVELPADGAAAGGAVVVVLADGDADAFPAAGLPATVVVPTPPYRIAPGVGAWTTVLETGERAAEKAEYALRFGEEAAGVRAERRVLAARGAGAVAVAWEVLLRRPGAFTHAILDGPPPAARVLLDRGGSRVKTRVLACGPASMPPAGVGVPAEDAGSVAEALRRALP